MTLKNALEILYLPATALKPSPHASRQHNPAQRRKLKSILSQFGQVVPLPLDATTGTLIDGHAVFDVLVELGHDEIAVVRLENRSEAEIRALRLALNRVGQDAVWNDKKLRGEFEYLISVGFDLDLSGFDTVEIDMALSIDTPTAAVVGEEAAEDFSPGNGPTVAQLGDIFHLGRHKVGCGDARDAALIGALAAGKPVACAFSDPNSRALAGEMSRDQLVSFVGSAINAIKSVLVDGAILYLCTDWRHAGELSEAASQQGLEQKDLVVWVKSDAGKGEFYRSQHELIHVYKYGEGPNRASPSDGGRNRSNVWQDRGVNAFGQDPKDLRGTHAAVKPVAMIADALSDMTRRGELVLDVFLGAGSVLIAAEETGRVCIGVEPNPASVDAAIKRWQKRTGKAAVHAATGKTFDMIAAVRAAPASTSAGMPVTDPAIGPDASKAAAGTTHAEADNV